MENVASVSKMRRAGVIGVIVTVILLLLALSAARVAVGWPRNWPVEPRQYADDEDDADYDVDVVFTWVDSSDSEWREAKLERMKELNGGEAGGETDATAERWTSPDEPEAEIELSLELLLQNAPWVRRIHIVTARSQRPRCLEENPTIRSASKRIFVVHHDEIWQDETSLPVFNSHAIEAHLHNIPDLAERFVYFNDDMFVMQPVARKQWFVGGRPILHPSVYQPVRHELMDAFMPTEHQKAWNNLAGVVPHNPVYLCPHQPYALSRGVMRRALDNRDPLVEKTKKSPFRSDRDIPPVGLALNAGLVDGSVVLGAPNLNDVQSLTGSVLEVLRTNPLPQFVCINASDDIGRDTADLRTTPTR